MAVNADATSPDYGELRILRMSDTTQIDGPGQTAQRDGDQRDRRRAVATVPNQGTAQASYGNLLTLPVGGGLLYVQPVYTQRQGSTGSYPALRFVLARFGQQVGIGDTLQEALDQVFAGDSGAHDRGDQPERHAVAEAVGLGRRRPAAPDNPAAATGARRGDGGLRGRSEGPRPRRPREVPDRDRQGQGGHPAGRQGDG